MVLSQASAPPPPPSDEFAPRAATNVARITEQTLNAIAFPTFVADLIKGTFQAIVNGSIQQMEAYGSLLSNVAKTVDQFMAETSPTTRPAIGWRSVIRRIFKSSSPITPRMSRRVRPTNRSPASRPISVSRRMSTSPTRRLSKRSSPPHAAS